MTERNHLQIVDLEYQLAQEKIAEQKQTGFDGGGGGGYDGAMEKRLTALEARLEAILPTLATKADLTDLKIEVAGVRTEVTKSIGDVRTELVKSTGELKAEITRSTGETQKWMIATVIGLFVGFGGLFMAMSNALKPSGASQPHSTPAQMVYVPVAPGTAQPSAPPSQAAPAVPPG